LRVKLGDLDKNQGLIHIVLGTSTAGWGANDGRGSFSFNIRSCNSTFIDDMGLKVLPPKSGEILPEIIMRRYENRSTMMTSNRPIEEWGKLLSDLPAAGAILDRLLHHANSSPSPAEATDSSQMLSTRRPSPSAQVLNNASNQPMPEPRASSAPTPASSNSMRWKAVCYSWSALILSS
jgi:hypothetical protein